MQPFHSPFIQTVRIMFAPGYTERLSGPPAEELGSLCPTCSWPPVNWFQCSQHRWRQPVNSHCLAELCIFLFSSLTWGFKSAVLNDNQGQPWFTCILTDYTFTVLIWINFKAMGKRKMYVHCIVIGFSSTFTVFTSMNLKLWGSIIVCDHVISLKMCSNKWTDLLAQTW